MILDFGIFRVIASIFNMRTIVEIWEVGSIMSILLLFVPNSIGTYIERNLTLEMKRKRFCHLQQYE